MTNTLQTIIIGSIAGILTTISVFPQIYVLLKKKSAKDLSISTYIVLTTGQLLWVVYGVLISNTQLLITNIISTLLSIIVIVLGVFFRYIYSPNIIEIDTIKTNTIEMDSIEMDSIEMDSVEMVNLEIENQVNNQI